MEIRRKVIGIGEIISERVKKEVKTKNTIKQTIIRQTVSAIKLDCGHLIAVTRFNKVPNNNTRCYECEESNSTILEQLNNE